jgi:hypothetical protein
LAGQPRSLDQDVSGGAASRLRQGRQKLIGYGAAQAAIGKLDNVLVDNPASPQPSNSSRSMPSSPIR